MRAALLAFLVASTVTAQTRNRLFVPVSSDNITATGALSRSGSTITCNDAAAGDGGCLAVDSNRTTTLMSGKRTDNVNDSFVFDTQAVFTNGDLVSFRLAGTEIARLTHDGVFLVTVAVAAPLIQANIMRPYTAGAGFAVQSFRSPSDNGSDFIVSPFSGTRQYGNLMFSVENPANTTVGGFGSSGEVYAGGKVTAPGDFVSYQGDPNHPTVV